jgi:hypothetical protein
MTPNTVTIKPEQGEGDTHKVFEMIYETANELVPKIIENVFRTREKSSFTIRCEAGYNKDEELVVKVSGGCSLPIEPREEKGEILEGKLRLW